MTLKSRLALRLAIGAVVFAGLMFVPAGSFKFWQGWAFLATWFVPTVFAFVYFYKNDPQLVERRLQRKETVREQKVIVKLLKVVGCAIYLLPGFDYRFGWSHSPLWLTILGQIFVLGGYLTCLWVMKVNSFAAATIQVEPAQRVISTGPYVLVRHPMYLGASIMLMFVPLALGSYVTLPAFLLIIPIIVVRLLNEEKILRKDLPGYAEYCSRTPYRLVPFVW